MISKQLFFFVLLAIKTATCASQSFTKVLEEEGVENAYPRWSKDGKDILFQSNKGGVWQIYIMNKDGGNIRRVMHDAYNNNFIDWSPDNRKIAFVSDRDGNEEIYIINTDGTGLKRLTNNPARDIHPYFSPDGMKILFSSTRANGTFDIYQIDSNGDSLKSLTDTDDEETCARYSPDMKKIVYLKGVKKTQNDEVFIMNSDGTNDTNITNSAAAEGWPVWTPDGKNIIFSSTPPGNFCLYKMDKEGNNLERLSNNQPPLDAGRASITKDGSYIVFNIQGKSKGTIGIYIMKCPPL